MRGPDDAKAIGLFIILGATMAAIFLNIYPFSLLDIGFSNIVGVMSGIWIILLKIVSLTVVILSVWAIFNIVKA